MNYDSPIDKAVEAATRMAIDNNDINGRIDLVNEAIGKLKEDPGAIFEKPIVAAIKIIRNESPPDWQRIRAKLKTAKVKISDLEDLIFDKPEKSKDDIDEFMADIEPWYRPVDGAEILDKIKATLEQYTIMPTECYPAVALWILSTYVYDCFRVYPKLCLYSPTKRCGKTKTLEIMDVMAHKSLMCSNTSAAVIFRAVDLWKPSLFIDEGDTFLQGQEELRGIINSGHTRSAAFVLRVEGANGDLKPKRFSTWAPMAIAMINSPPDTIRDRSVMIPLRRKLPGEIIQRTPPDFKADYQQLRQQCRRWGDDNADILKSYEPVIPNVNNDRAEDNWWPLLAVADIIGEKWGKMARDSMLSIEEINTNDDDISSQILRDIKDIFKDQCVQKMHSQELVDKLNEIEDSPWPEWRRGKPMIKTSLAKMLRPFKILPKHMRLPSGMKRGYELIDFIDAFDRYLTKERPLINSSSPAPPLQGVTLLQPSKDGASRQIDGVTKEESVTPRKPPQPSDDAPCYTVTPCEGSPPEQDKKDVDL